MLFVCRFFLFITRRPIFERRVPSYCSKGITWFQLLLQWLAILTLLEAGTVDSRCSAVGHNYSFAGQLARGQNRSRPFIVFSCYLYKNTFHLDLLIFSAYFFLKLVIVFKYCRVNVCVRIVFLGAGGGGLYACFVRPSDRFGPIAELVLKYWVYEFSLTTFLISYSTI